MEEKYTERDWKLFRSRLPQWQEAYMEKLNREYVTLLTSDGSASEKFWALEDRIKKDRHHVGVLADVRRSKLIWNLLSLLNEGAIVRADLDGFSEGLLETLDSYLTREDLW